MSGPGDGVVFSQGDGTVGPDMSSFELRLRLDGLAKRARASRKRADELKYDRGSSRLQSYFEGEATGLEVAMILMGMRPDDE